MEYKQAEQKLEQKLEENSLRTRWKLRNQEAESTEELQKNSIGDMVRKKVLKRVLKVILINIRRMQPRVVCAEESDASAEVGTRARLPCIVDPVKCGDVHSIKWYKNIHRVFVFSELAKISRSEGPLAKR
uniref:Ig-like domain-containing protein n=1 Tax=Rhodnius prolixus TaxID=13249 RepID=T1HZL4_RHOPR